MLNSKQNLGTSPTQNCLMRIPRWQPSSMPCCYRHEPGGAALRNLVCQAAPLPETCLLLCGGSRGLTVMQLFLLTGCVPLEPYLPGRLPFTEVWAAVPAAETAHVTPADEAWWCQTRDAAIVARPYLNQVAVTWLGSATAGGLRRTVTSGDLDSPLFKRNLDSRPMSIHEFASCVHGRAPVSTPGATRCGTALHPETAWPALTRPALSTTSHSPLHICKPGCKE
jgi:hypothetical protein